MAQIARGWGCASSPSEAAGARPRQTPCCGRHSGRPNLPVLLKRRQLASSSKGRRAVAVEARSAGGASREGASGNRAHRRRNPFATAVRCSSGIGDGEHLAAMGITVRHDLPGVGRNLHDHLASPVHMHTRNPVSYGVSLRAMPRNLWNVAEYLLFRRGPLANNVFESAAFVKSIPGLDKPDIQLVSSRPSDRVRRSRIRWVTALRSVPSASIHAVAGASLWRAPTRSTAPLIDPNLLSAPEDLAPMTRHAPGA